MTEIEATDILGRRIRAGDVVWISICHGSSAPALEQRRVLEVLPPLRTWGRQGSERPRLRVAAEAGLVRADWLTGRPSVLQFPERCLLHLGAAVGA